MSRVLKYHKQGVQYTIGRRPKYHRQWVQYFIGRIVDFYSASSLKQQSAIDMLPQLDTLSPFSTNMSLLFLLNAACLADQREATHTNLIVFGFTQIYPTIYCTPTQDEHTNHYTTDAVLYKTIEETYTEPGMCQTFSISLMLNVLMTAILVHI